MGEMVSVRKQDMDPWRQQGRAQIDVLQHGMATKKRTWRKASPPPQAPESQDMSGSGGLSVCFGVETVPRKGSSGSQICKEDRVMGQLGFGRCSSNGPGSGVHLGLIRIRTTCEERRTQNGQCRSLSSRWMGGVVGAGKLV